ncbi:hypothetical protein NS226_12790 [Aureimonas ureilytica]|uniref:Uncharacterized protein n=1 Tax=Aureimonas ureilytica TaxID=401562 RepID=A0A175R8X0_9HYPH|nr:hypothetical protein NS226_12790 [Aureimonas ureilytica]
MSVEQEILGYTSAGEKTSNVSSIGLHPLQQAASRLGDYRDGKTRVRAKDLVGLLLCHGARAWRAAQPEGLIYLKVDGPAGTPAVRISCGRSPRG